MTFGHPIEQWIPCLALAAHQFRGRIGSVAEMIVLREGRDLGHNFLAPRRDAIDGGVRQLGQRHRLRIDLVALSAPFLRDRESQRLCRQIERCTARCLQGSSIE